jgi:hypothetical protein
MGISGSAVQPVNEGNFESTIRFLIEWVSDGEAEARRYLADHAEPVALDYSIGCVTCTVADMMDAVVVGLPGAAQDRLPADVPGTRLGRPGVPR